MTGAVRGATLLAAAVAAALGCAGTKRNATGGGGSDGGAGIGGLTGAGGQTATGTGGAGGTGGACTPVSCTPAGGQYCGMIGDGCNSAETCPACPGDGVCSTDHICLGGPSCMALTCDGAGGAHYCGIIGDGCGAKLDCGTCAGGGTCKGSVCVVAGCVPLT